MDTCRNYANDRKEVDTRPESSNVRHFETKLHDVNSNDMESVTTSLAEVTTFKVTMDE